MATMDGIPGFGPVDDANFNLIMELLQQDCQDAASTVLGKGKGREGTETDAQAALRLFMEELRGAEALSADIRMARSLQTAIQVDTDAIIQSQNEEQIAQVDRGLSLRLSNDENYALPAAQSTSDFPMQDDELIDKLDFIYVKGLDNIESDDDSDSPTVHQPESSAWAASRSGKRTGQRRPCAACSERKHFAELSRAPCNHEYCRQCLQRLFKDAMVDESLFPPRCCKQPIPLDKNRIFLDQDIIGLFREKALEYSTPNRTYCHNARCASFIPPVNYTDTTASCSRCHVRTCRTCKRASHDGDCPNDEQLQQVIRLARDQGWQRCQNCWGMVELNTGCNHMTCRCGFQFCYVCGARWKSCGCQHWDEHRLLERAIHIDGRDPVQDERLHRDVVQLAPQPVNQPPRHGGQLIPRPVNNPPHHDGGPGLDVRLHDEMPVDNLPQADIRPNPEEQPHHEIVPLETRHPGRWSPWLDDMSSDEEELQEHERQTRLNMIMADLRANHECGHERWLGRRGPHECEECHDVLPRFIYECRQCHILACRRCRYHRL
ncbi:hypothetical protein GGS20DRAFT_375068 [Poronia punctata]|nr:hypothetical protein GGS20DRAFT_375068 [Poronia punctata]